MVPILSSWKEIAQYVGKGVRTVQRWERESRFPVRRPRHEKGAVLAYTAEIDAWAHAHAPIADTTPADRSEIERLRNLVAALEAENQQLRQELQAIRETLVVYKSDHAARNPLRDMLSLAYFNRSRAAALLQRYAESIDRCRNLRQQYNGEDGKPLLMRMLDLIQ